mmetsp:Transcript_5486/g.12502  ORF Transcript_5486/g.12502 Transcript_5486/m.12502 type:complete len:1268 (+) Transcript_5486:159-3962(+)
MSNLDCSVEARVGAMVQALLQYQGAEKQSLSAEIVFSAIWETSQITLEQLAASFADKIIRKSVASLLICSISWSSGGKRDGAAIVRQPLLSIHVSQQQLLNQAQVLVDNAQVIEIDAGGDLQVRLTSLVLATVLAKMTPDSRRSSLSSTASTLSTEEEEEEEEVCAPGHSPDKKKARSPDASAFENDSSSLSDPGSTKSQIYNRQLVGMTKGDLELMRNLAQEMLEDRFPLEFFAPPADKGGRPQKLRDEIAKELKCEKQKTRRLSSRSSSDSSITDASANDGETEVDEVGGGISQEFRELSIGHGLTELLERAGAYTRTCSANGAQMLSLMSGILVNQLTAECQCSYRKLPDIIATVITLLFGMIPAADMALFTRSVSCFTQAGDRAGVVMRQQGGERFGKGFYKHVCLCMDASNKGGKNLVTKPFAAFDVEGFIRQGCFGMDLTTTKKADLGGDLTFTSLMAEIGERGLYCIKGGSCDKFGEIEVHRILLAIDHLRMAAWEIVCDRRFMTVVSSVDPSLLYLYGLGFFGSLRIRTCLMHAFERLLRPLLNALLGRQGLQDDGTSAQSMFRCAYYMMKFRDFVNAMNVISVGGQVSALSNCPKAVRNAFKKICGSRWISAERQSEKMEDILDVPATEELVQIVRSDFDSEEEWEECVKLFTCIHQREELSHLILVFMYLANHTPGGVNGEGRKNLSELVAFLSSPMNRISIVLTSALYPKHMEWARFADGVSGTHPEITRMISTRMCEVTPFERQTVKYCFDLQRNWRTALPGAAVFLETEAGRAVELGFAAAIEPVVARFDAIMQEGTTGMVEMSHKYFIEPSMQIGFSVLYCVEPHLAAHWAVSFLEAMSASGRAVGLTEEQRAAFIPTYAESAPVLPAQPLTDWDVTDPRYAFPTITLAEFRSRIYCSFLADQRTEPARKQKQLEVDGILGGYALLNPLILSDITKLSTGHFLRELQGTPGWTAESPVSSYWHLFSVSYPALADSLKENFAYLLAASTIAEQDFTVATNIVHANATSASIERSMSYHGNAFGPVKRDMLYEIKEEIRLSAQLGPIGGPPVHIPSIQEIPVENKGARYGLLQRISTFARAVQTEAEAGPRPLLSKRAMNGLGKKNNDIAKTLDTTLRDMQKNTRQALERLSFTEINTDIARYTTSAESGATQLPAKEMHPLLSATRDKRWNAARMKHYIIEAAAACPAARTAAKLPANAKATKKLRLGAAASDPVGYIPLRDYLLMYWEFRQFTTEQVASELDVLTTAAYLNIK